MKNSSQVFNAYKPLRNHLRSANLDESLYVIWAYAQHFAYDHLLPSDIEVSIDFIEAKGWVDKKFFPWELEILLREVLLNSKPFNGSKSLRQWSYMRGSINKLKELEDNISEIYAEGKYIFVELFRIAHRQFPWQRRISNDLIIRYYKIFSTPDLQNLIEEEVGISIDDLYFLGVLFSGFYSGAYKISYPIALDIPDMNIDQEKIASFLKLFMIDSKELKSLHKKNTQMNDKFAYTFNPLRARPLIKLENNGKIDIFSPLPVLILHKLTSGIYFDLLKNSAFGNYFGDSFERYVGEVCEKSNTKESYDIIPETTYKVGKAEKKTVDWIINKIDLENSVLFIECKTKRVKSIAKEEIKDETPLKAEFSKIAEFVVQVYKSIIDYENGYYSKLEYDPSKKIYPIIVTLEDWYLFGGYPLEFIHNEVLRMLKEKNISNKYITEMPYTIMSLQEFEMCCQVIDKYGISEVVGKKVHDPEMSSWTMSTFLIKFFKEYLNNTESLFQDEYDALFGRYLMKTPKT